MHMYISMLGRGLKQSKLLPLPKRCIRYYSSSTESDIHNTLNKLYQDAEKPQTGISLRDLIFFGREVSPNKMITASQWIYRELRVRLARQVCLMDQFPYGLNLMPSVRVVRDWYFESYKDLLKIKEPHTTEQEQAFTQAISGIYQRHAPTPESVAKGVWELKQELRKTVYKSNNFDLATYVDVHQNLDNFYQYRIGMRMLIGQHLELHDQINNPVENYVGLISKQTSPSKVALSAIEDASILCQRHHLDVPEVSLHGAKDINFPYVSSHLYYMLFELVKNSMRAVVEFHKGGPYPSIRIVIADGDEDVTIKVSDEGGGIARSDFSKIWSYLYTTAEKQEESLFPDPSQDAPMAGFGYGLPLSRVYARYWRGDLNIMSMEGYGTDAYLHLNRLGDKSETLVT
ncbi:pyruvate dehydrogenase (acetyl-transferring) kinase, mitochondrial [Acrasis kona]|uniref:Protein-serine/threonine kinase n=1 Tax=Acrasis kona TaxID=1008807 RepID=A0AAW2YX10_9EUKA